MKILDRWTGSILHEADGDTLREVVEKAIVRGANLRSADLSGAYLRGADLSGADLRSANLSGADLRSANLSGADLSGANLRGTDLRSANLSGADLSGANLRGADMSGANLSGADLRSPNLRGADLSGANLRGANLSGAKYLAEAREDVFSVLDAAPLEAAALLAALRAGKIDGSTYSGECACLVGTIANARGCSVSDLDGTSIETNSNRPAERFFVHLRPGHTPDSSPDAAIVEGWILRWASERGRTLVMP